MNHLKSRQPQKLKQREKVGFSKDQFEINLKSHKKNLYFLELYSRAISRKTKSHEK